MLLLSLVFLFCPSSVDNDDADVDRDADELDDDDDLELVDESDDDEEDEEVSLFFLSIVRLWCEPFSTRFGDGDTERCCRSLRFGDGERLRVGFSTCLGGGGDDDGERCRFGDGLETRSGRLGGDVERFFIVFSVRFGDLSDFLGGDWDGRRGFINFSFFFNGDDDRERDLSFDLERRLALLRSLLKLLLFVVVSLLESLFGLMLRLLRFNDF